MGLENRSGLKDALKIGPQKIEWFVAVADGHGANGHLVSQFIAQTLPTEFENIKKRIEKQKVAKELIGSGQKGSKENELSESEQVDKKVKKALITSFLSV